MSPKPVRPQPDDGQRADVDVVVHGALAAPNDSGDEDLAERAELVKGKWVCAPARLSGWLFPIDCLPQGRDL